MLDKELEGFGELFRMLSWDEVGPASMLSRATAGLAGETLVFAMPGSTNAVKLAMTILKGFAYSKEFTDKDKKANKWFELNCLVAR